VATDVDARRCARRLHRAAARDGDGAFAPWAPCTLAASERKALPLRDVFHFIRQNGRTYFPMYLGWRSTPCCRSAISVDPHVLRAHVSLERAEAGIINGIILLRGAHRTVRGSTLAECSQRRATRMQICAWS